jgi:hypothetical protein
MMSGLLLGMFLLVCTCWFHNMVTLPSWLVSTDYSTCLYQSSLSNFTRISLHILKCSWMHTLSCCLLYCSFANIGHTDIMWSTVSSNFITIIIIVIVVIFFFFWEMTLYCKLLLTFWGCFLPHLQSPCSPEDEAASSSVVS